MKHGVNLTRWVAVTAFLLGLANSSRAADFEPPPFPELLPGKLMTYPYAKDFSEGENIGFFRKEFNLPEGDIFSAMVNVRAPLFAGTKDPSSSALAQSSLPWRYLGAKREAITIQNQAQRDQWAITAFPSTRSGQVSLDRPNWAASTSSGQALGFRAHWPSTQCWSSHTARCSGLNRIRSAPERPETLPAPLDV